MTTQNVYNITVFTIITSVIWLGTGIYTTWYKEKPTEIEPSILNDINLTGFDIRILENLPKKSELYRQPKQIEPSSTIQP